MSNANVIGLIGGSGLCDSELLVVSDEVKVSTPYGVPSSSLLVGSIRKQAFVFIARHGRPHVIPPHKVNYRANLYALKEQGVNQVVAVYAVGGISAEQDVGVISVPDQIIDYTYGREHTYSDSALVDLQHVDFTEPYSSDLRGRLLAAAQEAGVPVVDGGAYAAMQGPRLETAAEIRRLQNDGCDIVGMTGMPEAGLARELGMEFAGISLVVNKAAGLSSTQITMDDIHQALAEGMSKVEQILACL